MDYLSLAFQFIWKRHLDIVIIFQELKMRMFKNIQNVQNVFIKK